MTSSLRRKLPTTRRNTRRWNKSFITSALLALALASPVWAQSETEPAAKETTTQKPGAIDRLRQRNASERWRDLNQQPRSKLIDGSQVKAASPAAESTPETPPTSDPTQYRPGNSIAPVKEPLDESTPDPITKSLPEAESISDAESISEGELRPEVESLPEPTTLPSRSKFSPRGSATEPARLSPARRAIRGPAVEPPPEPIAKTALPEEEALPEPASPAPARARTFQRPAKNPIRNAGQDSKRKIPVREVGDIDPIPQEQDLIRTPKDLKRLSAIAPFLDYEPDPTLKDQCSNLCPRPLIGNCPECKNRRSDEVEADEVACPDCPEEVRLGSDPYVGRSFPGLCYNWVASDLYHYPLVFEDVSLERYGHTRPFFIQPFVSFGTATAQGVLWPYQSVLYPPCKKQYALGHYRPGDCVPYKYYQLPLSAKAALVEAAAITGGVYLYAPPAIH